MVVRWRVLAAVLVVMVGVAGCSGSTSVTQVTETPTSAATPLPGPTQLPAATTAPQPTTAPTAAVLPTPASTSEAENAVLPTWLRVNGFGPVDFGQPGAAARAAIDAQFGAPLEVVDNDECPGGPATLVQYDDFSLLLSADTFDGWYYRMSDPTLTTPSGVAPGVSRDQLTTAYPGVTIDETTLGQEFFFEVPAGFIGGFLTDDGLEVTALYAGTQCFFR